MPCNWKRRQVLVSKEMKNSRGGKRLMRLLDLGLSVQGQLRDLPYPAYLLSMSVIGRRLGEVYADVLPGDGRRLAARTTDAARVAYLTGEAPADEAWRLHLGWEELIEAPGTNGPLGMFSALYTFDMLSLELAGKMGRCAPLSQVTNAAKFPHPNEADPAGPRLVRVDPGAPADEQPGRAVDAQVR